MKLLYIAFQCCRNYHITFLFDVGIAPGLRKACGFTQMEFADILSIIHHIIHPDTGGNLWKDRSNQNVQCLEICLFRFLKSLLHNLSLTLRPGKIRIHQTETPIGYSLYAVQVVHSSVGQLMRTNTCCFYCLCNKGVNIIKLRLAQFNIHASQNINGICHCLPVKGHIVVDFQIQIPVQSLNRLFWPAYSIGIIQLIVGAFLRNIQIGVSVYRNQLNLSCIPVNIADHINICIGSLGHNIAPGIHTKQSNGPIALHLLCHILRNLIGSNAVHIEILRTLNLCHRSGHKTVTENQSQSNTFCSNHNDQTATSFFLLNLRLNSGRQSVCSSCCLTCTMSSLGRLCPSCLRARASAPGSSSPASAPPSPLLASKAVSCSFRKGPRLFCFLVSGAGNLAPPPAFFLRGLFLIQLTAFSLLPQLLFTAVISSCRSVSGSVAAVSSGILTASCFTSAPTGMLCPAVRGSCFPSPAILSAAP